MYSPSIENLIRAFSTLPTVGRRTAERFVFALLKSGKKDVGELTVALKELMDTVQSCEVCWDFADTSPCAICADTKREKRTICVVAQPQDVQAIEKAGAYTGTYHVLRGTIKPEDPDSMKFLKAKELFLRIQKEKTKEVIFALNPDIKGESTTLLLERFLKEKFPTVTMSRLARGLPMGSDLQYADEITLQSAFTHRVKK